MGLNVFVAISFYYVSAPEVCKPPIAKQGANLGIFSEFPHIMTVKMFLQVHVIPYLDWEEPGVSKDSGAFCGKCVSRSAILKTTASRFLRNFAPERLIK